MKKIPGCALLLVLLGLGITGWWWRGRRDDTPTVRWDPTTTRFLIRGSEPFRDDAERPADRKGANPESTTASLVVRLHGVRPREGTIRLAIFQNGRGFPADGGMRVSVTPETSVTEATIDGLVLGEYAVAVFQDLDEDGLLDKGVWGVPTEPYGFSNDARGQFGPPSFAAAAFRVDRDPQQVDVRLDD